MLKPLGGLKIDVPLLTEAFSKLPGEIIKSIPGLGQIIRALETIDFLAQRIAGPKPETPKPPTIEDPTTPLAERLGLGGGSGAGGGGGGSAEDTLKRQLETGQDLSREFSRQLQLLQATEGLERELLQIEFDREDRMRSIAEAAAEFRTELTAASDAIAQSQRQNAAQDAFTNFFQADQAVMEGLKDAQEEFNQFFRDNVPTDQLEEALKQSGQRVAAALTDSIGVAIEGLVTGAKDLNDQLQAIASSLLRDVGRIFLNAGINAAAGPGGLFGPQGLPGFADGGTIAPRSLAVVGERGPELVATGPQPVTVISNQEEPANGATGLSPGPLLTEQQHSPRQLLTAVPDGAVRRAGIRHQGTDELSDAGGDEDCCPRRCQARRGNDAETPQEQPQHPLHPGNVMRDLNEQIARASMMGAGIDIGDYEAIDLFAVPEMWLTMFDGMWCCLELVDGDIVNNRLSFE